MKTHTTIFEPVRPQATAAMILGTSTTMRSQAASPGHPPRTARPVRALPEALKKEAAQAREDIRRRYETPFRSSWDHSGLNE
jgi:hypothetical protein